MATPGYAPSLAGFFGSMFGYGPGGVTADQQLANNGITGPAQLDQTQSNQDAVQQAQVLAQLQAMAAGTGPSAAQSQLSAGLGQAVGAQQAAAAGASYGQNAAARQRLAAMQGASLAAGAANQAAQTRAREQQAGMQGAGALSSQMRGQSLQGAAANMQGQEMYNQQVAGLYGQEQNQQAQAGMQMQQSLMNALGGAGSMLSPGGGSSVGSGMGSPSAADSGMAAQANDANIASGAGAPVVLAGAAHGGVVSPHMASGGIIAQLLPLLAAASRGAVAGPTPVQTGEHGPEILVPAGHKGRAVLITHPMLLELGRRGRDVVLPLKEGSAPYSPGPTPSHVSARPTAPAPKSVSVKPGALAAMGGRGAVHNPGPGAAPLSPSTRGVVERALAAHGIKMAHGGIEGAPHLVGHLHPGDDSPRLTPRLVPHMKDGGVAPGRGSSISDLMAAIAAHGAFASPALRRARVARAKLAATGR